MILDRRSFIGALSASALITPARAQVPASALGSKLKRIKMATIAGPDLGAVEKWYAGALDYKVIARAKISAKQAASWGVPGMTGRDMITMAPESGGDVWIRACQIDATQPPKALTTWGWSSIEIALQDTDKLYAKLKQGWLDAPMKVLGEPKPIAPNSPIYAMQIQGPAGEVLYLTSNTGDRFKFNHPDPKSFVDRPFIAVLAGPDLAKLKAFYIDGFQMGPQGDAGGPIQSRATAHGMPADHVYRYSVAVCAERGNKIELDEFPAEATGPQKAKAGQFPMGTVMFSFSVANFDGLPAQTLTPPEPLYDKIRAATLRGPAGELTELIADRT